MKHAAVTEPDALWARHHAEWRDPAQIASQWREAADTDPALLWCHVRGAWWETLAATGITLLVTREYEHLVMSLSATPTGSRMTYWRMPHPSGLAVDRTRGTVHIASTRNPNLVYDLAPVADVVPRRDMRIEPLRDHPLVPVRARYYPGCLYMHDLAFIRGELCANAVGQNAIVRLDEQSNHERIWWPRCIEVNGQPIFTRNHLQLNSIAAGTDLAGSYFSASTDRVSPRCPGHKNFPVDGRGVVFAGGTGEPVLRGLTRPHSARLHAGKLWVDNSGYGEVGLGVDGRFEPVARLPGWTRGLCFHKRIAFVGTSRVLPRFRQYAPGLDPDQSRCGVHALDTKTGQVLGSLFWPAGNQIFALEQVSNDFTSGFPFRVGSRRATVRERKLFYTFTPRLLQGEQS